MRTDMDMGDGKRPKQMIVRKSCNLKKDLQTNQSSVPHMLFRWIISYCIAFLSFIQREILKSVYTTCEGNIFGVSLGQSKQIR